MSTIKISDFPLQPSQSVDPQIDIIPIIDEDNQVNSTITPEGLGSNLTVKYALTASNISTTTSPTGGLIGTLQEVTTLGNSTDITINANNITINGEIISNTYTNPGTNVVHPITSSLSITSSYYLAPDPSSPPPVKTTSSFAPFPLSKGNSEMWGEQYTTTQGNSINSSQQIGGINGYIWEDLNNGGKFNNDPLLDGIGSGNGKNIDHQRKLIVQSFISPCNWSTNYTDATSQQYQNYANGGIMGTPILDISPFPRYLNMTFTNIDNILSGDIKVHIQIYKHNSDPNIVGELIAKGESYFISSKGVVSIPLQGITIDLPNITSTESNFELIKGHRYYISFEFIRLGGNGDNLGFHYGDMLGNGTRVFSFRPDFDTTTLPGYSFNGNNAIYSNNFQFVYRNINNGSGEPEFRFGNDIDLTSGGTSGNNSDHKLTLGRLEQQSDEIANFSTFRICCELFNRAI
jgi:hypothetical protein